MDRKWWTLRAVSVGTFMLLLDVTIVNVAVPAGHCSLHERLLSLPGHTEVWPGHLGGSLCGGPGMDMKICSTLAYERAHNELLGEQDETSFVERAVAGLGPQPLASTLWGQAGGACGRWRRPEVGRAWRGDRAGDLGALTADHGHQPAAGTGTSAITSRWRGTL